MPFRIVRVLLGLATAVLLLAAGLVPAEAASSDSGAVERWRSLEEPTDSDGDGIPDDTDQCPFEPGVPENYGCPYLGPTDTDGDGVYDDADQCPNEPGSSTYNGCPAPDSDGDGITDDVDACPDLPGPYDGCPLTDLDGDGVFDDGSDLCPNEPGLPEYSGCPAPDSDGDGIVDPSDSCPYDYGVPEYGGCPVPDSDGDGITDDVDQCPYEYGDPSYNGCPYVGPSDSDGDGVTDDVDQCPYEYGDPNYNGCPYVPPPTDSDGDGVTDDVDQCPFDPGPSDRNGCPIPDSDGDGLPDDVDACPDLPGPYDGCPLTDLDGDGVYDDGSDLCPNEPGLPEYGGCPAPDSDGDGMTDDSDQCDDTPSGDPIDGVGCSLPQVTATPPSFDDRCGNGRDTVTVPSTEGVAYYRGGAVIVAGTYRVRGTVTLAAEAAAGYVLVGTAEWTATMTAKACPPGRLGVGSPRAGKIRLVNRETVAMVISIGTKVRALRPGEIRVISSPRGRVAWSARWRSPLIRERSGSVIVG